MSKSLRSSFPDVVEFTFGDEVYHKTKTDEMGIVIAVIFEPGCHQFKIQWSRSSIEYHYAFELSKEKGFTTD